MSYSRPYVYCLPDVPSENPLERGWVDHLWLAATDRDSGPATAVCKSGAWYAYNVDGFGPESYCEWDHCHFEREMTGTAWDFEGVRYA